MNSLVKVFSNFKEFYSEINGATLTGAIDVVVVEQPDGTFICSPFHVRFGKLGVLRSREKVVDIEVNGEPVDIHMKLGESGEAFFIEECDEESEEEELTNNLASTPILGNEFAKYEEQKQNADNDELPVLRPRRNSIDFSKDCDDAEATCKFENQLSDYKHRRHTDNLITRRDLSAAKNEFTTQKIRQEWAEHEQELCSNIDESENTTADWSSGIVTDIATSENDKGNVTNVQQCDIKCDNSNSGLPGSRAHALQATFVIGDCDSARDESKSKKKRRKRSFMKKKLSMSPSATFPQLYGQRKASSSSTNSADCSESNYDLDDTDPDLSCATLTNHTHGSTPNLSPNKDQIVPAPHLNSCKTLADFHFFSDTEVNGFGGERMDSRPSTPIKSDSEIELARSKNNNKIDEMSNSASWKWGELPTPAPCEEQRDPFIDDAKQKQRISMISNMFNFMKQSKNLRKTPATTEGVYLSDLDVEGLDPEVEALYFPPISPVNHIDNDDHESGNGTSLPHSPSSIESPKSCDSDFEDGKLHAKNKIELSICGGLEHGGPTDKEFENHIIDYQEVCQNPTIFSSPSLVVRVNDKYYDWTTACPIIMTSLAFQKPLANDAIEKLVNRSVVSPSAEEDPSTIENKVESVKDTTGGYSSWWYWRRSAKRQESNGNKTAAYLSRDVGQQSVAEPESPTRLPNTSLDSQKSIDSELSCEKYKKTLRLSSERIESLNLKDGMNEVVFSVTTAYQGTSRCKCYLFRWKHNDKVVISDIDGTITKSDVLGHILPMVGRDWAQLGVAQLFSKIEANGYKLLYLSARAIGQSRVTREYLRSIRQGDVKLPDGPLLLNPTSLISALHREVIERKPEQFKIACLSDIQALFPQNPFYAGYGNRINDVWAYRAVGIPIMRIFTINPKGELKHELTQTFQSSYCSMTFIVDQLFPPDNELEESNNEFSNVNYWRDPILDLNENMLSEVNSNDGHSKQIITIEPVTMDS